MGHPVTRFVKKLFQPASVLNAEVAFAGFRILGPEAADAIPQLARLINDTNSPETANRALAMLGCTGTNGLPVLLTVITNPGGFLPDSAIGSVLMFESPTNLLPIVPILAHWFKQESLAPCAERRLKTIAGYPGSAIYILTNDACAVNEELLLSAIMHFEFCGPPDSNAVPYLLHYSQQPNLLIRNESLKALRNVDSIRYDR